MSSGSSNMQNLLPNHTLELPEFSLIDFSFFSISVLDEMRVLHMPCSTNKLHFHLMGSRTWFHPLFLGKDLPHCLWSPELFLRVPSSEVQSYWSWLISNGRRRSCHSLLKGLTHCVRLGRLHVHTWTFPLSSHYTGSGAITWWAELLLPR